MSIHNTRVSIIKTEIETLKRLLNNGEKRPVVLEQVVPELLKTSKTLYNIILKEYKSKDVDQKIAKMLDLISKIQKDEISQYDASGIIGTDLAKQYINVVKKQHS